MKYGVIAGGSRGIGYAIATALARRHYNLILIARHWNDLFMAKQSLESVYGIKVELLQLDLSEEDAAEKISEFCNARKLPVSFLCNVAGLGGFSDFLSLPMEQLRYMVKLNLSSQIALCHMLLPILEKNTPAYILNVASMAGLAPIPKKNLYSSTKSAIIVFSYSLRYQLKNKNISVSCLSPGPVYTKAEVKRDTITHLGWFGDLMAMGPSQVGEIAVKKTLKGKILIIPGFWASIMAFLLRLLPRKTAAWLYYQLGKNND